MPCARLRVEENSAQASAENLQSVSPLFAEQANMDNFTMLAGKAKLDDYTMLAEQAKLDS